MQEMEAVRPDYPEHTKTKSNDGQESMFTAAEQPGTTGGLTDAVSELSDATAALHFYCCSSLTSHNLIAIPLSRVQVQACHPFNMSCCCYLLPPLQISLTTETKSEAAF